MKNIKQLYTTATRHSVEFLDRLPQTEWFTEDVKFLAEAFYMGYIRVDRKILNTPSRLTMLRHATTETLKVRTEKAIAEYVKDKNVEKLLSIIWMIYQDHDLSKYIHFGYKMKRNEKVLDFTLSINSFDRSVAGIPIDQLTADNLSILRLCGTMKFTYTGNENIKSLLNTLYSNERLVKSVMDSLTEKSEVVVMYNSNMGISVEIRNAKTESDAMILALGHIEDSEEVLDRLCKSLYYVDCVELGKSYTHKRGLMYYHYRDRYRRRYNGRVLKNFFAKKIVKEKDSSSQLLHMMYKILYVGAMGFIDKEYIDPAMLLKHTKTAAEMKEVLSVECGNTSGDLVESDIREVLSSKGRGDLKLALCKQLMSDIEEIVEELQSTSTKSAKYDWYVVLSAYRGLLKRFKFEIAIVSDKLEVYDKYTKVPVFTLESPEIYEYRTSPYIIFWPHPLTDGGFDTWVKYTLKDRLIPYYRVIDTLFPKMGKMKLSSNMLFATFY